MEISEIKTTYDPPPIPIRDFDWCASVFCDDGDKMCGWGRTEKEAIDDLEQQLADIQDDQP